MIYSIDTARHTKGTGQGGDGDVSVAQDAVGCGLCIRSAVCLLSPLCPLTSHANSNLVVSLGGADMAEEGGEERAGRTTEAAQRRMARAGGWHSQRQRRSVSVPAPVDCHVPMPSLCAVCVSGVRRCGLRAAAATATARCPVPADRCDRVGIRMAQWCRRPLPLPLSPRPTVACVDPSVSPSSLPMAVCASCGDGPG